MKRLFVLLALIAIVFASCKKYETSEELDLNTLPKVAITGTVYADLDESVVGLEPVKSSLAEVTVTVSVPYSYYFPNSRRDSANWVKSVTVDGEGNFSVEIPVITSGVTATITFSDFTYNVTKLNSVGEKYTVSRRFNHTNEKVSGLGKNGAGHIFPNIEYSVNSSPSNNDNVLLPTTEVNISGKLQYQSDDTTYRDVPYDTKITAIITLEGNPTTRQYKTTLPITVQYGGTYSIAVPMVERGKATVVLSGEGFWDYTNLQTNDRGYYRHELNQTITVYNYPNQTGKDFQYTKTGFKLSNY